MNDFLGTFCGTCLARRHALGFIFHDGARMDGVDEIAVYLNEVTVDTIGGDIVIAVGHVGRFARRGGQAFA